MKSIFIFVLFCFFLFFFSSCSKKEIYNDACTISNLHTNNQYYSYCDGMTFVEDGYYYSSFSYKDMVSTVMIVDSDFNSEKFTFTGIMKNSDFINLNKGDKTVLICTLSGVSFKDCYYK